MATRRRSRRKARRGDSVLVRVLVPVVLLLVVVGGAFVILRPTTAPQLKPPTIPACPDVPAVTVGPYLVPAGPIAGFCQAQLVNAAQILRAAQSYGLSVQGEEIGVMTAIGESSLRNVNYGALADRMDPYTAARAFFMRMRGIVSWETLSPTVVAHTVQRNADPDYYTQYWHKAVTVVTALNRTVPPAAVPTPAF